MITSTAPGKAVLAGEYVVLADAPAIAAAVDRRVHVSLEESAAECHAISAPGYLEGSWDFQLNDAGQFSWKESLPAPSSFSLVEEIWKSFDTAQWPSLTLVVDTREFSDATSGTKFGLGSSAAVAVALTATLQKFCAAGSDTGELALRAHDRFQGGRGSGIDVATSMHGGVILFRRGTAAVQQLDWPADLHYRYLWSGRAAVTSEKLGKLERNLDVARTGGSMDLLSDHAQQVAGAWSTGDAGRILESLPAYIDALQKFSVDHDLGIFDAGHADIARRASDQGVVYKPCGAGGGDVGIVLAATGGAIEEFCELARQQDFHVLDIALDSQGVLLAE